MKSTKFLVLGLVLSVGLLFSCNKEQMAFNKLEGKWKVEKATLNGITQELPSTYVMYIVFGDCDAGSTCTFTSSQSSDGGATYSESSENFTLSDDGKQMMTNDGIITIEKLTKTELNVSRTDSTNTIGYEMIKQ